MVSGGGKAMILAMEEYNSLLHRLSLKADTEAENAALQCEVADLTVALERANAALHKLQMACERMRQGIKQAIHYLGPEVCDCDVHDCGLADEAGAALAELNDLLADEPQALWIEGRKSNA